MSPERFAALSQMMRQRSGSRSRHTAELMLVRGMNASEAAREVGITPQTAAKTLKACRKMLALAAIAVGAESSQRVSASKNKTEKSTTKED